MSSMIVTANRLLDGKVVYLSADGSWREVLQQAVAAADEDGQAALEAQGRADEANLLVVGAYLMPVVEEEGVLRPTSQREAIRAQGPSIRIDLDQGASLGAAHHV